MTEVTDLPSPSRLVGDGVELLRRRFWLLLGVMGAGGALAGAGVVLPLVAVALWQIAGSPGVWAWTAAWIASLSAALWLGSWAQVALFEAALSEDPTLTESFRRSWARVGAFSWTSILYMVFVGGGLLLFILPGLYLAAALVFAPLISLEEDVQGLEACRRSLRYARGRWSGVAGRLLLIGALGVLPGLIPVVGWLAGGLIAPLPLLLLCLLYRSARESPAEAAPAWPLWLGLAGWIPGLYFTAGTVAQLRALWPDIQVQARQAARNLDAAKAQKLLADLQSGQATPRTALDMARLLREASAGIASSTAPVSAAPPAEPPR